SLYRPLYPPLYRKCQKPQHSIKRAIKTLGQALPGAIDKVVGPRLAERSPSRGACDNVEASGLERARALVRYAAARRAAVRHRTLSTALNANTAENPRAGDNFGPWTLDFGLPSPSLWRSQENETGLAGLFFL